MIDRSLPVNASWWKTLPQSKVSTSESSSVSRSSTTTSESASSVPIENKRKRSGSTEDNSIALSPTPILEHEDTILPSSDSYEFAPANLDRVLYREGCVRVGVVESFRYLKQLQRNTAPTITATGDKQLSKSLPPDSRLSSLPKKELTFCDHPGTLTTPGLGPKHAFVMSLTLHSFENCHTVNLSSCTLDLDALSTFSQLINNIKRLKVLNLSNTGIGRLNAKLTASLILKSLYLESLDLSSNGFDDSSGTFIAAAVEEHRTLQRLHLSHNSLGSATGRAFNSTLSESFSALTSIRGEGAIEFINGLRENIGLTQMNLAWNGIRGQGAITMGLALSQNASLLDLDISSNQIDDNGLAGLILGLSQNETLQSLSVGGNVFQEATLSQAVMTICHGMPDTRLTALLLQGTQLSKEFETVARQMELIKPGFKCHWDSDDNYQRLPDPDRIHPKQLTKLLRELCEREEWTVSTLCEQIVGTEEAVNLTQFVANVEKFRLNVKRNDMRKLFNFIDRNKDGLVDTTDCLFRIQGPLT